MSDRKDQAKDRPQVIRLPRCPDCRSRRVRCYSTSRSSVQYHETIIRYYKCRPCGLSFKVICQ